MIIKKAHRDQDFNSSLTFQKSLKPSFLKRYHITSYSRSQISVFELSIKVHPPLFLTTTKPLQKRKRGCNPSLFSFFSFFTNFGQTPTLTKISSQVRSCLRIFRHSKTPKPQHPLTTSSHFLLYNKIKNNHKPTPNPL